MASDRLEQRATSTFSDDLTVLYTRTITGKLVRFTGTVRAVRAVGTYDAKSFTFQPISRTIVGVTAPICTMLEFGLKTRH